ncbi:cytochrome P450/oxidoreductase [Emcibacter sp.]|uniref:cytochrome P450/oxidoreductase n=1 Tax=Emcibacter sp. TaxID=1979954 RepID=UPI002AA8CE1E|nr:cytochrome P450/oxidoreductase [Emcibacter sp.]
MSGSSENNAKPVAGDFGLSPTGCPLSREAADFDIFEGPYQVDPAEALRWSRDREPVFYNPKLGYWIVTRYDDVKAVFRDNILFSPSIALEKITPAPPEAMEVLKKYGYAMDRTMVNEDEPAHMARRRVLMDSFLPEALERHQDDVRKLTRDYMDRFIDRGEVDLVNEMFWDIPLIVALHFLGVSGEDRERLRAFSVAHTVNTWGRPSPEEQIKVADSVGKFWQTAMGILDRMKEDPSGDGWMHYTIRQHLKYPDIVPESYLRSMMMAILSAAHETTSNATANMFKLLLSRREVWEDICENPDLIPNAVEECLRLSGSIIAWRRLATDDTRVGDVDIPKGSKLLIVMISANHDERHFENPDEIDLYRDNTAEHLSFGYGSHQCMGKNIARMEMRIFLEEFIKRLPHMELVPDQSFSYLPNTSFRGPKSLWARWDPGKNPETSNPSILESHRHFKIGAPSKNEVVRELRVAEVHEESEGVRRLVLGHPHGRDLPGWTPGAHIDLIAGGFDRKYSLCGDPADRKHYEVAILKEPGGRGGSIYFHDKISPGDTVSIIGPKNHFRLDEKAGSYLLIAGGIGITPVMAMADRLKALGKDYQLHYAGQALDHMSFVDRLKRNHADRLHLYPKNQGQRLELTQLTADLPSDRKIYACGPDRMLEALEELSASWPEHTLNYEHFTSVETTLDPSKEKPFDVTLADSGVEVHVRADQTLLQALRDSGVDVSSDCEEGLCGACEVQVLDGEIDHRDKVLSKSEKDSGDRIITCCSRARGRKLVLGL